MATPAPEAADPTTMNGDNSASNSSGAARLDQPSDAVAMKRVGASPKDANEAVEQEKAVDQDIGPSTAESTTKDTAGTSSEQAEPAASEIEARQDLPAQSENAEQTASKGKEADTTSPVIQPLNERQDSIMAIGPAQDEIKADSGPENDGPVCNITLLLTTGTRHPYKLDAKYLTRRNVSVPENTETGQPDPFSISIYTLKELILREWRSDWETKPASPSSIRLIHFGKLLDDKEPLKKYHLSSENPNVIHMSIRPQDLDEEEPKGGKNASSGGGDGARLRRAGCCVIL